MKKFVALAILGLALATGTAATVVLDTQAASADRPAATAKREAGPPLFQRTPQRAGGRLSTIISTMRCDQGHRP